MSAVLTCFVATACIAAIPPLYGTGSIGSPWRERIRSIAT
jgi:hypothetical protein